MTTSFLAGLAVGMALSALRSYRREASRKAVGRKPVDAGAGFRRYRRVMVCKAEWRPPTDTGMFV